MRSKDKHRDKVMGVAFVDNEIGKPVGLSLYKPMKLEPCRVYRTFLGGKLLEDWLGTEGEDTHFPENWIASTVKARNVDREKHTDEGYSFVVLTEDGLEKRVKLKDLIESDPIGMLGKKHFDKYGTETAVLVKLVDSALRLTIQVHPTAEAAMKAFNYPFGKTEAWYILATRSINGSEPYVLLGFKEGITRQKWLDVYNSQDIPEMINLMHRIPVKPGDMILVKSGVPHGMGEGVLFVEIQESCDITLRTEKKTPTGAPLTDEICSCGVGVEAMMDMFDYNGLSTSALLDKYRVKPRTIIKNDRYSVEELIGPEDTDCFSMYKLNCSHSAFKFDTTGFKVLLVNKGCGLLHYQNGSTVIQKGETYFVPASINDISWQSDDEMEVLICCPPGGGIINA